MFCQNFWADMRRHCFRYFAIIGERWPIYVFNARRNDYFFDCGFIEAVFSNTYKSFLESHTGEILTIIECILSTRFNSSWNNYFSDWSIAKPIISNTLESLLENYTSEIITILECTISNWFDSFWNDYFSDWSILKPFFSNTLKAFRQSNRL